jgi:hypothetical protein
MIDGTAAAEVVRVVAASPAVPLVCDVEEALALQPPVPARRRQAATATRRRIMRRG